MASPFQQQVRQRKLVYAALILVLFTGSWVWRTNVLRAQAKELAIREEDQGEVELSGAVVRLGLTGSRGLAICILWNTAIDKQRLHQWNELEVYVRSVTKLQPHFITPWLFQSWNLSYNVSVESDRIRDKYFYISRGLELLAEGERQNRNHPDLRFSLGDYMQHKICQSDETNYLRSLFQLSLIPTNERDPARFWKQTETGPVFNWLEFDKFVQDHPQLIRRLKEGMYQESMRDKKRIFRCDTPEAVVQFLNDNYQVPALYRVPAPPADLPFEQRHWDRNTKDELLPELERFPVLPPELKQPFDAEALSWKKSKSFPDSTDAFAVSHAWYCYAQEPLPLPGKTPGSSEPITDRYKNRLPRYMTTLIFRDYPAQGLRFMAERLGQEGWYDEEPWDVSDWFEQAGDNLAGKIVRVGGGVKWSENAWRKAEYAWRKHGEDNHLIMSKEEKANRETSAKRFAKRYGIVEFSMPPKLRTEEMSTQDKQEYDDAMWMFNYAFYRQVSNFEHHLVRAAVEARPETVACRKLFYEAEQLNLVGKPVPALEKYQARVESPAWPGKKLNPLEAWRDLILQEHKEFRLDSFTQEQSAEYQVRYMYLFNRNRTAGLKLKEDIGKAATLLPLVPKFTQDTFRPPIFEGPFDVLDAEGKPLIEEHAFDIIFQRMHLPTRRTKERPARPGSSGARPEAPGIKPPKPPVSVQ